MSDRPWMNQQVSAVRALLDANAGRLPSLVIDSIDELLQNEEPNEALLTIAWSIESDHLAVSPQLVALVREAVGDPNDLPTMFQSGPATAKH